MKILVFVLFSAIAAVGQQVPGRYVVELAGDPAAISAVRQGARFAARSAGFAAARAAVRQAQSSARREVASRGGAVIESMDTVVNALVVTIPEARAAELEQIAGVTRVHPVDLVLPLLNHALAIHRVTEAWAALPLGRESAGAGMKIALIDSGIDVNHPAFSVPLPAVPGFPKVFSSADIAFTNAKIIVARNYTRLLPDGGEPDADDRDGHGTGTAMAAAGGPVVSPYGPLSGVAPAAYIGNYKVLGSGGTTSDIVAKAIDDAVADGMDVINLSLGSYVTSFRQVAASALGVSTLEGATRAGVIVVVAAGQFRTGRHYHWRLRQRPGCDHAGRHHERPLAGQCRDDRRGGSLCRRTRRRRHRRRCDRRHVVRRRGHRSYGPGLLPPARRLGGGPDRPGAAGYLSLRGQNQQCGRRGAAGALIYNNGGTSFLTRGQGVGTATLPTLFLAQSAGMDLKDRIAANPNIYVTLDFKGTTAFAARTDVSSFSSRGPNLGSALKPDLVAVGEEIVTGAQRSFAGGESYGASGYIDTAGTSFSAPLAAGAAAVLKSARPGLTQQQYRSLLINSATAATKDAGSAAGVQQAGAGVLNLAAALNGTIAAYPTSLNFGSGAFSIRNTLSLSLSNTGTAGDTYTIAVAPSGSGPVPALSRDTFHLDPNGSQQVRITVDAPDLAPGEYQGYLRISGTAGVSVATVPYWFAVPGNAPAGISVLVPEVCRGERFRPAAGDCIPLDGCCGAALFGVIATVRDRHQFGRRRHDPQLIPGWGHTGYLWGGPEDRSEFAAGGNNCRRADPHHNHRYQLIW